MNADSRPGEVFEIEPSDDGGLLSRLPWWLILTVAFVVTELTAHPAIGVSVLCMKFGWNDFRTGLWLRQRDPHRARGAVCSWFYIASGLWRVCLWSIGLSFVAIFFLLAIEGPQLKQKNPAMPPEVMACMVMWLLSFSAATLLTMVSAVLAWSRGVKVWISGRISEIRQLNVWPPRPVPKLRPDANLLKWWLIGAGAGVFVILFIVGLIFMFDGAKRPAPGANKVAGFVAGTAPFVSALAIVFFGSVILEKTGAKSPEECWAEDADPSNSISSG